MSTFLTTIGKFLTTWPPAAKNVVFIESQVICIFRALNVDEGFDKIVNDKFSLLKIEKNVCKAKMSGIYILLFLTK